MTRNSAVPFLHHIYNVLLLSLPPLLFFSYHPVIYLGADQTMNFELSLPLIWLVVFDLVGVGILLRSKVLGAKACSARKFFRQICPWLLFPVFLVLSVAWSLNCWRGWLTAGVFWLIVVAIGNFFALRKIVRRPKNFVRNFWRVFFASSLVAAAWCWLQSILDLVGLPQTVTLMCDGCVTLMFGFPHPNGFAIEPQFMGNLLLAPTLLAAWFAFCAPSWQRSADQAAASTAAARSKRSTTFLTTSATKIHCGYLLIFCVLAATLFLTFSRGAIYAFLIGLILLTVFELVRDKSARPVVGWVCTVVAFLFTLNAQGLMSELGPTTETYQSGVAKVLHHLSLGLIDVRQPEPEPVSESESELQSQPQGSDEAKPSPLDDAVVYAGETLPATTEQSEAGLEPEPELESEPEPAPEAIFDGYIAASTDTRVRLTKAALQIWRASPKTVLFGVGLGGAGQALYNAELSLAPKEIVQNQYASLLLETGLVGCALALWTLYLVLRAVWRSSQRAPLLALLAAYAVTLFFFSGLPNALQIYLLPPLILALTTAGKADYDVLNRNAAA